MAAIVEGLFASTASLSKAFNADEYVNNGKIVFIIPNAGASGTKKNLNQPPGYGNQKRTDIDVTFLPDEYTTDPGYLSLMLIRWNSAMINGSPFLASDKLVAG